MGQRARPGDEPHRTGQYLQEVRRHGGRYSRRPRGPLDSRGGLKVLDVKRRRVRQVLQRGYFEEELRNVLQQTVVMKQRRRRLSTLIAATATRLSRDAFGSAHGERPNAASLLEPRGL